MENPRKRKVHMESKKNSFVVWWFLGVLILIIGLLLGLNNKHIVAGAAQKAEDSGQFMTITQSAMAYSDRSTTSTVVTSFASGDTVLVVNEESDWVQILYQGEKAYVKNTGDELFSELVNVEAADELEKQEQIDKAWIESYYEQMRAIRVSKVWRALIIAVIVLAVGYIVFRSVHQQGDKTGKKSTK